MLDPFGVKRSGRLRCHLEHIHDVTQLVCDVRWCARQKTAFGCSHAHDQLSVQHRRGVALYLTSTLVWLHAQENLSQQPDLSSVIRPALLDAHPTGQFQCRASLHARGKAGYPLQPVRPVVVCVTRQPVKGGLPTRSSPEGIIAHRQRGAIMSMCLLLRSTPRARPEGPMVQIRNGSELHHGFPPLAS